MSLAVAKLSYFSYIASLFKPFLKIYQTDKPTMPFLFDDLKELYKTLFAIVVKPEILKKSKSAVKMLDLDLDDKNYLKTADIHVGLQKMWLL